MNKLTVLSALTLTSIFLAGSLQAGSPSTLTTGIGAGAANSGLTGNPYVSQRRSTNTRNDRAGVSIDNFRGGSAVTSARGAPTAFPGAAHMNSTAATNAGSHLPSGVFPLNGASNPGSVTTSAAIPGSASVGSSSAGFVAPPATIPGINNIPAGSTALGSIPSAIGGGISAPPSATPPSIPTLSTPAAALKGTTAAQAGLDRRGAGRP